MIEEQFNINILSDDPTFCTSLTSECNKFGFSLTFFEEKDIGNEKLIDRFREDLKIERENHLRDFQSLVRDIKTDFSKPDKSNNV